MRLDQEHARARLRRRLVERALRHDEDLAALERHHPFRRVAQADLDLAVQHQEELVGVLVDVPDVLAA